MIEKVFNELGVDLLNVIRICMFVMDIFCWEEVGKVYGEFFGQIQFVVIMVEVSVFIDLLLMVEIEVEVIIESDLVVE